MSEEYWRKLINKRVRVLASRREQHGLELDAMKVEAVIANMRIESVTKMQEFELRSKKLKALSERHLLPLARLLYL